MAIIVFRLRANGSWFRTMLYHGAKSRRSNEVLADHRKVACQRAHATAVDRNPWVVDSVMLRAEQRIVSRRVLIASHRRPARFGSVDNSILEP